jgi:hypothetical protein
MDTDVPAVEWADIEFVVDGQALAFSYADLGHGNWAAFREFSDAHVYIYARDWPAGELPTLPRIHDLTAYLQGSVPG